MFIIYTQYVSLLFCLVQVFSNRTVVIKSSIAAIHYFSQYLADHEFSMAPWMAMALAALGTCPSLDYCIVPGSIHGLRSLRRSLWYKNAKKCQKTSAHKLLLDSNPFWWMTIPQGPQLILYILYIYII